MPRKTGMDKAHFGPEETQRVIPVDASGSSFTDVQVRDQLGDMEVDLARLRRATELVLGEEVVEEDTV